MEKNKKEKAVDVVCPNGLQPGHDFCVYDVCKTNACEPHIFNVCGDYRRGCIGKADFGSYTIAKMTAIEMSGKYEYAPYRCQFCGGWHIGKIWD